MSRSPLAGRKGASGEAVSVCLPAAPAGVFEKRAGRLRELAPGHAAGDFLTALASLAEAQRLACRAVPIAIMGGGDLWPAVPLNIMGWRRGEAWREVLGMILAEMGKVPLPEPAQVALARLAASAPLELEAFADALLGGVFGRMDVAAAPFVGAALQVYWTVLASGIPIGQLGGPEQGCPVCGSPPVAGVVLGDDRLRYLTCSLCATEWNLSRVMCANCRSTKGISYFAIEGDPGAAKAEACEQCRTYLKLFYLEKGPRTEPFADDAATLSLDLLMSEEGYSRGGVNLFLLSGADS
jgi:FdhE protein